MPQTLIIRGPMIRFEGNPAELGDEALVHETDGALAIADGRIQMAGLADAVIGAHPGAEIRSSGGALIAPGFVDAHVHYSQLGIVASWGADLIDWLNRFTFPEEERLADPAIAAEIASAYFDEQLSHGITCAASFCTSAPASVDAYFAEAARRGVRAVGGKVMMDRNAPPGLCDTAATGYDQSSALIGRWHGKERAVYAISPRFAPTSTPEQLEAAGALWAEHPGCVMQSHLSEQPREVEWVRALFPGTHDYLDVYDRFGLTGPGAVFGHAIHLTGRERAHLRDGGSGVAHCPTSNQFLGSGECDVAGLAADRVVAGLGTDTGGGTSFSMFATMKAAYKVARRRGDTLTPATLWWLATVGAARVLRLEERIGNLAPGQDADFILIDCAATPLLARRTGRADTITDLLFALIVLGDDRSVAATWSGGREVHRR